MRQVSRRRLIAVMGAPVLAGLVSRVEAGPAEGGAPTNSEVEARIQWIITKYGSRLNDAQRADIRRIIASGQSTIDAMRAYALENSVGPAR